MRASLPCVKANACTRASAPFVCQAKPARCRKHCHRRADAPVPVARVQKPVARLVVITRASDSDNASSTNSTDNDYVEVKIEHVKPSAGSSIVFLKVVESSAYVIPVHIGESESNALIKEINKQKQIRPLTHDLTKMIIETLGWRMTKMKITEIQSNTYYARIHLTQEGPNGTIEREADIDSRPSDALNLALRFNAPMYVKRQIAEAAKAQLSDMLTPASESSSEIMRSVRDTVANFEDPTLMYQLQQEVAVKEERFEEAAKLRETILYEMTHNRELQLIVAMETAMNDGRYEEAARLRDAFHMMKAEKKV